MLIQDIENELDGEEEDEEAAAAAAAKQAEQEEKQANAEALRRMDSTIRSLAQKIENNNQKGAQDALTEADAALRDLISLGKTPKELESVVRYVEAVRKDLEGDFEKKLAAKEQEKNAKSLNERCQNTALDVLRGGLKGTSIEGNAYQERALMAQLWDVFAHDSQFEDARKAYNNGSEPSRKDFEKAARLVLQTLPKELGFMNSRDSSGNQFDNKNSRPAPHPAIGRKGEVDVDKLTDYEREIYEVTMNETHGNKDLALKALRTIGQARK